MQRYCNVHRHVTIYKQYSITNDTPINLIDIRISSNIEDTSGFIPIIKIHRYSQLASITAGLITRVQHGETKGTRAGNK